MLCFEDVALALRKAESRGEVAAFVVDRTFDLGHLHAGARLEEGMRVTAKTLPSILGWVAAGLALRLA